MGGPQGPDAYLLILMPTVGETMEFQNLVAERDMTNPTDMGPVNEKFFKTFVKEWNWVDDNDNPLPQPQELESFMSILTLQELTYISDILSGKVGNTPNNSPKLLEIK